MNVFGSPSESPRNAEKRISLFLIALLNFDFVSGLWILTAS